MLCTGVEYMNIYDDTLIENIEVLLRRVCFIIKKRGRRILDDYNITPAQFDALQYLICNGELTISELSSKLYQVPSTTTDLIDRMEKNLLVERIKDPRDRRIVRIKVLDKGHKVLENVLIERCKFLDNSLKGVCDEDKLEFTKYLKVLFDANNSQE
ncbi:transcriptional regulator [Clostridium argentinense CDC 2741]|uniref:Transcriptional regulator n=2 Tax=Clostridium argentinense TaxID=29341 RepID=A0A0C1U655_9CLOT|nr:transcriptional regulator [Clostridium argentinense CDC 2741]